MTKAVVYNDIEYFLNVFFAYAARTGQYPKSRMEFTPRGTLIAIIYINEYEAENY